MTQYIPKNIHNNAVYRPAVSFAQAQNSYFISNNQICSVKDCDSDLFRAVILSHMPQLIDDEAYNGFLASPDSLVVRWYLLLSLAEQRYPVKLYSRDQAEEAIHERSATACR